jgi:hypothetical protein
MAHLGRWLSREFSLPALPATGRELEQGQDETFCAVAGHNQHGNRITAHGRAGRDGHLVAVEVRR